MLSFVAQNLVENHIDDIQIEYEFSSVYLAKEPLLVSAALVTLFVTLMICVRMDFSLIRGGAGKKKAE